jgi:anion-transporting  ArsA/GET3 family ATPase
MGEPAAAAAPRPVRLGDLVLTERIIVCCGAGGVGKTTTSAALAIASARAGRKVLVLTIDPSRRLAETLGVSRNPPEPVPLPADRQALAGIRRPALLDAWMLDPKLVADESVRRLVKDPVDQERILTNRIYQQVSAMVAGMHEYTAMEALHRLVGEGRYDLVILDTPPSRNALDFLDAPRRLARLMEGRVFQAFLPKKGNLLTKAASRVVERIFASAFGDEFASELVLFLSTFSGIFASLNVDVNQMRDLLSGPGVSFLLVTSPAPATLEEAHFFQAKAHEAGLPFRGFVLNRSLARTGGREFPSEAMLGAAASPEARSALAKLQILAKTERDAADRDQALLTDLQHRAGAQATAVALPNLSEGADDMATLITIADVLARS